MGNISLVSFLVFSFSVLLCLYPWLRRHVNSLLSKSVKWQVCFSQVTLLALITLSVTEQSINCISAQQYEQSLLLSFSLLGRRKGGSA